MILAVVDDLMFSSKIKTTAGQLGTPVTFARSKDAALAEMRKQAPTLVIFDLNSGRTDPLGIVGAMVGGFIFTQFGAAGVTGFNLYSMFVAVIGAIVILVVYHAVFGRR